MLIEFSLPYFDELRMKMYPNMHKTNSGGIKGGMGAFALPLDPPHQKKKIVKIQAVLAIFWIFAPLRNAFCPLDALTHTHTHTHTHNSGAATANKPAVGSLGLVQRLLR